VGKVDLAKQAGVDIGVYFAAQQKISEMEGSDKKRQVTKYLGDLGLDRKQKDLFMYANGYKQYTYED